MCQCIPCRNTLRPSPLRLLVQAAARPWSGGLPARARRRGGRSGAAVRTRIAVAQGQWNPELCGPAAADRLVTMDAYSCTSFTATRKDQWMGRWRRATMSQMEPHYAASQREVQRLLGRCLIRLQQCEHIAKKLAATCDSVTQVDDARRIGIQAGTPELAVRTLGPAMQALVKSFLKVDTQEHDSSAWLDERPGFTEPSLISMRMTSAISINPDDHQQIVRGLGELVKLRNNLVHQFLDLVDIRSSAGCAHAIQFLEDSFLFIDQWTQRLNHWLMSLAENQEAILAEVSKPEFEELFLHGVGPEGGIDWGRATIVECLLRAEAACSVGGWALLAAAIEYLRQDSPDQIPSRYGCRTWKAVLSRSGRFDVRVESRDATSPRVTKFRRKTCEGDESQHDVA